MYMNVLHTNGSSTIGDVPFLVWRWVWATTGELRPSNTHHGHFPIGNFVHVSSITQKLLPSEIYRACSMRIRSDRTGCGCGVFMDVSESGCGNVQNFFFLFQSYLHNHVPKRHIVKRCDLNCMIGELQPQIYIANFAQYAISYIFQV